MASVHTEERIGEAWQLHRMNNNPAAITIFQEILDKNPKDIDALYGLGLAQRAYGENNAAIDTFEQALEVAQNGLKAFDNSLMLDGKVSNSPNTDQDDRFLMLSTMIKQRLAELGQ
jgi:Flp pilus assembly protein TadD